MSNESKKYAGAGVDTPRPVIIRNFNETIAFRRQLVATVATSCQLHALPIFCKYQNVARLDMLL